MTVQSTFGLTAPHEVSTASSKLVGDAQEIYFAVLPIGSAYF